MGRSKDAFIEQYFNRKKKVTQKNVQRELFLWEDERSIVEEIPAVVKEPRLPVDIRL